jgi:hypothetical protein
MSVEKFSDRLTLEQRVMNRLRLYKEKERTVGTESTSICSQCHKTFNVKEVERVYGDTFWKYTYCSAQCYTKAEVGDKDEELINKLKIKKPPKDKK